MKTAGCPSGILFLGITLLLVASGCRGEKKEGASPTAARMEAILAVHDEVMPRMKELSRLVAELKPLADSTEAGQPYLAAMKDLQVAHQSMMDWMTGFGDRFDHAEIMEGKALNAQKQDWLKEEEVKVQAMRDQVIKSIGAARDLLARQASE